MSKLSKVDFHILRNRLTPDWLIKKTNIFDEWNDRPELVAPKFREYWDKYIKEDLEKVLTDYAKRLDK